MGSGHPQSIRALPLCACHALTIEILVPSTFESYKGLAGSVGKLPRHVIPTSRKPSTLREFQNSGGISGFVMQLNSSKMVNESSSNEKIGDKSFRKIPGVVVIGVGEMNISGTDVLNFNGIALISGININGLAGDPALALDTRN